MINVKVRLKNKTFLLLFIPMALAFIYQLLGLFGIVPAITQGEIESLLLAGVELLGILGIITDPTTKGFKDGKLGATHTEPQ